MSLRVLRSPAVADEHHRTLEALDLLVELRHAGQRRAIFEGAVEWLERVERSCPRVDAQVATLLLTHLHVGGELAEPTEVALWLVDFAEGRGGGRAVAWANALLERVL